MRLKTHKVFKSIATISLVAMLFACTNTSNDVKNLFFTQNLPIAIAKDMHHVYKDSGRITSKLNTALLKDYSNRKNHPYKEFPKGVLVTSFDNNGKDSITIRGDYGLTYAKTFISELHGNVVIINHAAASKLETEQLFWDQKTGYFYSEKKFTLTSPDNIINGVGFESKKDLSKFIAKQQKSQHIINEN
jgi:LPS export ABC transporter protein LptC